MEPVGMKEPSFSIIMPINKVEDFWGQCIGSDLTQTFEDYELILVDDGSPDKCPHICDENKNKDRRISVVHKQNGGLPDARNYGLNVAGVNRGHRELIHNGENGYLVSDMNEMAQKVMMLLADDGQKTKIGSAIRAYARDYGFINVQRELRVIYGRHSREDMQ